MTLDLPERMRWDVESGGMKFTVIMNGAQGARGPANDLAEITPSRWTTSAIMPTPCRRAPGAVDRGLHADTAAGATHRRASRAGASRPASGRGKYLLFFDKETKLFQGMAYKGREGGQLVDREIVWKELKDYDGVKLPSVITEYVAGRKIAEWRQNQYDLTKPDPKAFKLP
jgi:hypothetical protein